jgi:hypothetical protein
MPASLSGVFNVQQFTDIGTLAVGGRIYTYAPSTTTHKTAFTDQAGTISHTYTNDGSGGQYIALNARGELPAPLFLTSGGYDIAYKTAAGVTVWTRRAVGYDSDAAGQAADLVFDALAESGGAALVGYSPSAAYAEGTLGSAVKSLQATDGDIAAGPRDAVVYVSSTSVRVFRAQATMGGFRFRGQYTKNRAPTFAMPASKVASTSGNLGAESAVRTENWYAVFACADSGDSVASLRVMPFLRAGTVSGSNVPLIKAGESVHALTAQTYAWSSTNNLASTDCLIISEGGVFSGRVTTITANSSGQVTLAAVGSVAAYDFLLPAPPGFDHYVYLGCFYFDTAEVRNIADAGSVVKAKLVNLTDPNFTASGAISTAVRLRFGGYISPLATAVVIKDTHTLSTSSTGAHAGYYWHDSSDHEIAQNYESKTSTGNETFVWDGIELPFSQWQDIWYLTGGGLAASRSGATIEIKGWIEP